MKNRKKIKRRKRREKKKIKIFPHINSHNFILIKNNSIIII
jgi:hypothetical protein